MVCSLFAKVPVYRILLLYMIPNLQFLGLIPIIVFSDSEMLP